ncbi:MAG: Ig domain-containing protein [Steroidobacteraceae bacterium]
MPDATVGFWYQARIGASGAGALPLTWSLRVPSALPAGLTLDKVTGVVFGMPTAVTPVNFSFAVQVTDVNGQQAVATIFFNVVQPQPFDPSNPYPPLRQADFYAL